MLEKLIMVILLEVNFDAPLPMTYPPFSSNDRYISSFNAFKI